MLWSDLLWNPWFKWIVCSGTFGISLSWIRYQIGGKMFAAICLDDDDKPYYITLKLEPLEGYFWRKQYEDIIPGYYMMKN